MASWVKFSRVELLGASVESVQRLSPLRKPFSVIDGALKRRKIGKSMTQHELGQICRTNCKAVACLMEICSFACWQPQNCCQNRTRTIAWCMRAADVIRYLVVNGNDPLTAKVKHVSINHRVRLRSRAPGIDEDRWWWRICIRIFEELQEIMTQTVKAGNLWCGAVDKLKSIRNRKSRKLKKLR